MTSNTYWNHIKLILIIIALVVMVVAGLIISTHTTGEGFSSGYFSRLFSIPDSFSGSNFVPVLWVFSVLSVCSLLVFRCFIKVIFEPILPSLFTLAALSVSYFCVSSSRTFFISPFGLLGFIGLIVSLLIFFTLLRLAKFKTSLAGFLALLRGAVVSPDTDFAMASISCLVMLTLMKSSKRFFFLAFSAYFLIHNYHCSILKHFRQTKGEVMAWRRIGKLTEQVRDFAIV